MPYGIPRERRGRLRVMCLIKFMEIGGNGYGDRMLVWLPHYQFHSLFPHKFNLFPITELDMMFTHPSHRRKGHGSLLMKYGMDIAATMAVEVIVEASDQGIHLYKKFGLRTIEKIAIDTLVDGPSPLWKKMQSEFGDVLIWWMWKPHGGVYEAGVTELPWMAKAERV